VGFVFYNLLLETVMNMQKNTPVMVLGGSREMRDSFLQHLEPAQGFEAIEFPSRLACCFKTKQQPKSVVFLPGYSSVMLSQASDLGIACYVMEEFRFRMGLIEGSNIHRYYLGPCDIYPYFSLGGFAKELLHQLQI
jgi:hypothetical protein